MAVFPILRSDSEVQAYKDARQSQYDTWVSAQPKPSPVPSLEDRVKTLEAKAGI